MHLLEHIIPPPAKWLRADMLSIIAESDRDFPFVELIHRLNTHYKRIKSPYRVEMEQALKVFQRLKAEKLVRTLGSPFEITILVE